MQSLSEEMHSFKGYGKVDALHQEKLDARRKTRRRIIILSITSLVLVAIIVVVAVAVVRSKSSSKDEEPSQMQTSSKAMTAICNVTLYPDRCISSLSSYPGASKLGPKDLFDIAVVVALGEAQKALPLVSNLPQQITDPMQKQAINDCEELIEETIEQLSSSNDDLKNFKLKSLMEPSGDVRTWLSAALTNLDTCVNGLADTASSEAKAQIQSIVENLTELTSNSLAIVNNFAKLLSKLKISFPGRRLLTDDFYPGEDGFPGWVSATDRRLLQANIEHNVTVAKDGLGNYRTIQEAVDAAPSKSKIRYIIMVKEGIYEENVQVNKSKTMLMIVGAGMDKTIVTGDKSVVGGTPTFRTATFVAVGMGFIAKDIQFRNTAGPSNHQAVALRVGSDKSLFLSCNISAYQDTLYTHSLRQFYRECYISGTVDFIFGNAAVVFQNCIISARLPGESQKNTITAQGRTDPNQNTGISIQNCSFTGEADLIAANSTFPTYLGRPWKLYSRTVIMISQMDGIINPAGWLEWNGDFALDTLYYAEYQNSGAGAAGDGRVKWPGFKVITDENEALKFTVGQFIGSSWLQETEVTFSEGLTA
uniref:Pectinesterase n=1 Tax=Cunninghamia lanceolata TaxID=28977 RepID=A0A6G9W1V8_CUNLA|nr:pectin methylesterase 12 [Cunninghamia lanceolata]